MVLRVFCLEQGIATWLEQGIATWLKQDKLRCMFIGLLKKQAHLNEVKESCKPEWTLLILS